MKLLALSFFWTISSTKIYNKLIYVLSANNLIWANLPKQYFVIKASWL